MTTFQLLVGAVGMTMFLSAIYITEEQPERCSNSDAVGALGFMGLVVTIMDLLIAYGRWLG